MARTRVSGYGVSILGVLDRRCCLANIVVWRTPAAAPKGRPFNRHAVDELASKHVGEAPRADREHSAGIEQERCDNRAFPADQISSIRRARRVATPSIRSLDASTASGTDGRKSGRSRHASPPRLRYTGRETDELGARDIAGHLAALREA